MQTTLAFIGSQTNWQEKAGEGIYICSFDTQSGALTPISIFKEIENPSFLALSIDRRYLYSVSEVDDFAGKKSGAVAAFSMNATTGHLTLLGYRAVGATGPCHVSIDKTAKVLIVANYSGGSATVFPIQADGSLGEYSQLLSYEGSSVHPNQTTPHAHSAIFSPDNQYVFIQDLGTDKIRRYRLMLEDNNPQLIEQTPAIQLQPGAGPRHFVFHPSQAMAYLLNELNNTVVVFDYQAADGNLLPKQTLSSLPAHFTGQSSAADIHLTHNGRFLYASNRGHDSLAIFAVHPKTGELTLVGHQSTLGEHPRNFVISTDDRFLLCANRNSDEIVCFHLDKNTGELTPQQTDKYFCKPVCVIL
jgi:6-phosphogluconolactonase